MTMSSSNSKAAEDATVEELHDVIRALRRRVAELELENQTLKGLVTASSGSSGSANGLSGAGGSSRDLLGGTITPRPSTGKPPAAPKYRPTGPVVGSVVVSEPQSAPSTMCTNCGNLVPETNLQSHMLHCYRVTFRCPMCGDAVPVCDKDAHLEANRGDMVHLAKAIASGDKDGLNRMLAHGASVAGSLNDEGDTPVHLATRANQRSVLELLFAKGADVNVTNKVGETALHIACASPDRLEITAYLLSQGITTTAATVLGDTAMHIAQRKQNHEAALMLSQRSSTGRPVSRDGLPSSTAEPKLQRRPSLGRHAYRAKP